MFRTQSAMSEFFLRGGKLKTRQTFLPPNFFGSQRMVAVSENIRATGSIMQLNPASPIIDLLWREYLHRFGIRVETGRIIRGNAVMDDYHLHRNASFANLRDELLTFLNPN